MLMSTDASAEDIIIIMKGKLIHTLKTQTVIFAKVGSARNSTLPSPSQEARIGSGLCGVATSQFQEVADTTTGTTQGRSSRTLNRPPAGIRVRSRSAKARPTSQLPKTPVTVKIKVNKAPFQNQSSVRTLR